MIGIAVWTAATALRIEIKNVEAGSYLPRGVAADSGTWRVSREGTPRDELRSLVKGVGLLQYPLSVCVIVLGVFHLFWRRYQVAAALCVATGLVSLGLAFYRGYFSSLGW